MPGKEDYCLIGVLTKTHGISGELVLKSGDLRLEDIQKMESVFIEFDGILVPFFIAGISQRGDTSAIIRFDDIESEDQAAEFVNCKVYSIEVITGEKDDIKYTAGSLTGYQVIDVRLGSLGVISEYLDFANNPLFKIKKSKREILLPVNEEFILEIDNDNKIIKVQTPEGLVDIYQGK
ncbi:MAG: 16S rRNA processing protein RimM [Bacteroidales bacterium]|nr:16S rRNA processing protein RimM [Bacteroidales bacterium]